MGTLFYDQKGSIVINKQSVAVRNEIMLLAKNRLTIVVVDNDDNSKLYGRVNGLRLLTGSAVNGTAWGDRSGYTLNFEGKERELAPFVTDAAVKLLQT